MNLNELKPANYNPRVDLDEHDDEYQKLKNSIEHFGYVDPIIWNKRTNTLVGGHQRLKVVKSLGWETIDVSVVDLSPEDEKALNIALNKIEGDWDNSMLAELLEDLQSNNYDLSFTGFDFDEINDLLGPDDNEVEEGDFDVDEAIDDIKNKDEALGLWQLGDHRLLCGDSTKLDDILRLVGDNEVDMIFTDPPYNVNYEGGTGLTIQNDNMEDAAFYQFLKDTFDGMFAVAKPGAAIYVCHADSEGRNFRNAFHDSGFLMKQCLIWVKNTLVLGRQDYQWKHEPILYGWKPGASHNWYNDRKQTTVIQDSANVVIDDQGTAGTVITFHNDMDTVSIKVKDYEIIDQNDDNVSTIWRIDKPKRNGEHPTMKPIELCAKAIKNSSKKGDIVFDPFGGSGSTLIACEQTGRKAVTMEFDPVYAAVIIRRWEDYTGKKAMKIGD